MNISKKEFVTMRRFIVLPLIFAICIGSVMAVLFGRSTNASNPDAETVEQPPKIASEVPPLTICVELPSSAVGVSQKRKATRTECSPAQAKSNAILAARVNAFNALQGTCGAQTSRAEADAACAAQGLTLVTTQNNGGMDLIHARATQGGSSIDAAFAAGSNANARLCVVLRDLKDEFESVKQGEALCVFDGFKRTIFTARSRARCGVQCL